MTATEPDQIVVATDDLRLVANLVGGEQIVGTKDNVRLGLSLLTLTDVEATLRRYDVTRTGDQSTVDALIGWIRTTCAERYDGWLPTLGQNRTLTGIQFKPYSNGGGFDSPVAVAAGAIPPIPEDADPVDVGLFDTRIAAHDALTGRFTVAAGAMIDDASRPAQWWEGHATFIAGLILRSAPSARLVVHTALKRSGDPGSGEEWTLPLWDFAERLEEFEDAGVRVINMSLGCSTPSGAPPLVLERAISRLTGRMVVVAAAGNHGTELLDAQVRETEGLPPRNAAMFPAALDGVLAVGATQGSGLAEFNPKAGVDTAQVAPWIDVFAPGVELTSTYLGSGTPRQVVVPNRGGPAQQAPFSGWASWSGTSFSAGIVTGRIAGLIARGTDPMAAAATIREESRAMRERYLGT